MQVSTILDDVRTQLFDPAPGVGWTDPELMTYLNEALTATAFVKPDCYVVETPFTLAAGMIQNLPSDGVALIDVPRNSPNGRVVTQVDKELLDESNRFWPAGTMQAQVEHYTEDPRNPRRFVVFPPNNGAGVVDLIYGAVPPTVTYDAEELSIPDSYQHALTVFVLSKCYSKASARQSPQKAQDFMKQWGQMLGMKSQAQIAIAPKVDASPGTT